MHMAKRWLLALVRKRWVRFCLAEIVQLVKDVAGEYVGSHNFHNFTSGKKFTDPSARRYMFSINVSSTAMESPVSFSSRCI